ncbi:hypothetical protein P3T36_002150 [Kitasatospora sp. MAP12-15]|uniref:hypothetical protein n=1 Tax=unclassified Kitasatospora TaxID=2633591 RepID=UPI002475096F|nr:hypothetical protein [Kitasatospora sp. MAP12-44]MDH6111836.1 hypothetical protein [Kitasatospora sp. MAP12-44]
MERDLVFVGGGFRTTTFLASAPELLAQRIDVFERSDTFGPGGFLDYAITSTSVGSRFLKELSYHGPFAALRDDPDVAEVALADQPVRMERLAAALRRVGSTVADALGHERLHLGAEVTALDIVDGGSAVVLSLADGGTVRCRHAVLATGRIERQHPELAPWQAKVLRSAQVISRTGRDRLRRELEEISGGRIVVAGSSHSAMSAVRVLLEVLDEIRVLSPGYRAPTVDVLQRGPARLTYASLAEAREQHVPGREPSAEPETDVCPVTGIVFRDSGLRHESRSLYCALWDGEVPGVRLVRTPRIADAADLLDDAALVVQALGYHGNVPEIRVDGLVVRQPDAAQRLTHTPDGAALIAGRAQAALSVLRVEPTPHELRDHAVYGSGLYGRLATRILARLGRPAPVAEEATA